MNQGVLTAVGGNTALSSPLSLFPLLSPILDTKYKFAPDNEWAIRECTDACCKTLGP